jgi:hypothetical protein
MKNRSLLREFTYEIWRVKKVVKKVNIVRKKRRLQRKLMRIISLQDQGLMAGLKCQADRGKMAQHRL